MGILWTVFRIPKKWEITQRDVSWDIGPFLGLSEEANGTERTHTNLKQNGILLVRSWYPISNIADIQSSEHPVRWIGDSWRRQVRKVRFAPTVTRRVRCFYFARLILEISSVSLEQSRIGSLNWFSRFLVSHFQGWRNPLRKCMSSYIENWSGRRCIRWYEHLSWTFKQREIDRVITKRNSRNLSREIQSVSDFWISRIH